VRGGGRHREQGKVAALWPISTSAGGSRSLEAMKLRRWRMKGLSACLGEVGSSWERKAARRRPDSFYSSMRWGEWGAATRGGSRWLLRAAWQKDLGRSGAVQAPLARRDEHVALVRDRKKENSPGPKHNVGFHLIQIFKLI
jgi:hypothetical protein